ncbi:hypothetical protein HaLaN_16350, partial [Haematococcus lacustris]
MSTRMTSGRCVHSLLCLILASAQLASGAATPHHLLAPLPFLTSTPTWTLYGRVEDGQALRETIVRIDSKPHIAAAECYEQGPDGLPHLCDSFNAVDEHGLPLWYQLVKDHALTSQQQLKSLSGPRFQQPLSPAIHVAKSEHTQTSLLGTETVHKRSAVGTAPVSDTALLDKSGAQPGQAVVEVCSRQVTEAWLAAVEDGPASMQRRTTQTARTLWVEGHLWASQLQVLKEEGVPCETPGNLSSRSVDTQLIQWHLAPGTKEATNALKLPNTDLCHDVILATAKGDQRSQEKAAPNTVALMEDVVKAAGHMAWASVTSSSGSISTDSKRRLLEGEALPPDPPPPP